MSDLRAGFSEICAVVPGGFSVEVTNGSENVIVLDGEFGFLITKEEILDNLHIDRTKELLAKLLANRKQASG